jgi:hypothetical protein
LTENASSSEMSMAERVCSWAILAIGQPVPTWAKAW